MTGHAGEAPRRRPRRRGLIALVAGLCTLVTVAGLLALGTVTGFLGNVVLHPLVNPAPWGEGDTIRPVRSTDPQIRSVVRSQQYEVAWRALVTGLDVEDLSLEYSFDPEQRRGDDHEPTKRPPSYRAGISVFGYGDADVADPSYEIDIGEYGDPSDATAAIRADRARWSMRTVSSPTIEGASQVAIERGKPVSLPCDRDVAGKPTGMALHAVVDGSVELSVLHGCVGTERSDDAVDHLMAIAAKTVRAIRTVRDQPVPASWMPGTAEVPIISSGGWHQSQLQVAGRRDGLNVDPLLDAPFAGSGVRQVYYAENTVYAYANPAAARAVFGLVPGVGGEYRETPHLVDRGESDERQCAAGEHWQQGTTCWSRVGRFVVVQTYDENSLFFHGSIDESQAEALQEVR